MSWKKKFLTGPKVRAKARTGYALAACTLDGRPVVQLRVGTETCVLEADDVDNLRVRLEQALLDAGRKGGVL